MHEEEEEKMISETMLNVGFGILVFGGSWIYKLLEE
jgi:hypothetical protein